MNLHVTIKEDRKETSLWGLLLTLLTLLGALICLAAGIWYGIHGDFAQGTYFLALSIVNFECSHD